ncbi:MAG: NAD-dependent epimerase/dehydratase family protein, partial [Patescibacteria group bacterium]
MDTTPIFEKKNVLVTGGAGFIGSHLCEQLLREAKVICMDDLSNSTVRNIEHLLQYPDFEFIKHDVNHDIDLDSFDELYKFKVKFQGIQEIYHLACPTSPKNFESLKLQSLWANSNAMIATLDLAVKYRAKYVFASSSVVYGPPAPDHAGFAEEDEGMVDHLSPRACYDEGKRFAETCVATYRQVYGVDAKIARVFTTYGPRMK